MEKENSLIIKPITIRYKCKEDKDLAGVGTRSVQWCPLTSKYIINEYSIDSLLIFLLPK